MRLPVLLTTALLSLPLYAAEPPISGVDEGNHISKGSLYNLLIGEFARNRGDYDQALNSFEQEIGHHNSPYLAERTTRLAMYQKRFPDMLEAAQQWQKSASDDALANFFLSLAYSLNQRPVQALEQMRIALRAGTDTDFIRLVNLLPDNQSYQDLYLNELTQLYREYDDSADLPLALAILHLRENASNKASTLLDEAIINAEYDPNIVDYAARFFLQMNQPSKALAAYKSSLELQPFNLALRQKFAIIATRHDLDEAMQQFQIITTQSTNNDYAIYHLALIYLDKNRLDDARAQLQKLLHMQRREDSAHYYLGLIDKFEGKLDNALSHFQQIQQADQKQRGSEQIAGIYLQQQKPDMAMQTIEDALQQKNDTDRERLQGMKVEILRKQNKTDEAFSYLETLLKENPDAIDLRFSRAMLAEANNQLQQAEKDLRYILQVEPNSTLALNALGYTLADRTDRYPEALQLIQQAHELEPEDPAVLDSMGWVLYRMGRYDEAVDYLKTAFTKYPDAEVAAHLGEVLWMMGQKEDATKVLKQALDVAPDHNKLNETIKRLDVPL